VTTPFHWNTIKSEWIFSETSQRLDASFYAKDIVEARILLDKIGKKGIIKMTTLNDPSFTSRIFWPTRFKRKYTMEKEGRPFLMPKEVFQFFVKSRKFILNPPENLQIKEKWILVTRSGSIGRCLITDKVLLNYVISDDLIRIILKDEKYLGYIYAFLNTWMGQAFLTKTPYGETVKHIESEHIANIPLPLLPESDIKRINEKILEAHKLREEARELLITAQTLLLQQLQLSPLEENDIEFLKYKAAGLIKAFETNASELDYRLDASYHVPVLKLIRKNLQEGQRKGLYIIKRLGDGLAKIFDLPTYKRTYVKSDNGYPVLSGSHLNQMKLYDLKYIHPICFYHKGKKILDKYKVKKGWILTTERGTTGVSALVTEYWDGWLASHNILRVVPENINAGFLLSYLLTAYGQYQLRSKELGAVVEVLDPRDMENLLVPVPVEKTQQEIGNLVIEAYEKKDQANILENETIKTLEEKLMEVAK
jgi:type I restriction enzyme S subunit